MGMAGSYINFCFKNIEYDDQVYCGIFEARDYGVYCEFFYDRKTKDIDVWNNNVPVEEILPIPVWWLERKLKENGKLKKLEARTCY